MLQPSMVRVVRATSKELENAVTALRDGELVAFPTETVYGLGANAQNPAAVRRIFELKERPADHPVIVHLDNPKYLHRWARDVPENAQKLAARFWPGPLTMVLPRSENVHDVVTGGQDTVAIRVPVASHGAAAAHRLRWRHRRALGESLRPRESDARRARARGIRRRRARGAGRRRVPDRPRIDHRELRR